jgi:predicted nucleotidyltransferase
MISVLKRAVVFMVITEEMQNIVNVLIEELPIEKLYLFGSYAYGTPTDDSDYDFYVLIPSGGIKPIDAKINARRSLSRIARKRNTDILTDYKDRFEQRSKYNTLEKKVAKEGLLLYERS